MIHHYPINITPDQLDDFCQRWRITELALFGSVLRDDFHAESDIDMVVTFHPKSHWSLFDRCRMEMELEEILHRKVDTLTKRAIERSRNPIRRHEILNTAEVIYES